MNRFSENVTKVNKWIQSIGVFVSGIAVIGMMILIVTDVALRNLFSMPISGTYEIVQYYLMPLAIFPALAFTYSSGVLPKLTEIAEKAPKKLRWINHKVILVIELVIFTLLTVYGWKLAMSGVADQMAIPVSGELIPLYPVYFLVPLGFAAVLLEIMNRSSKELFGKKKTIGG